MSAQSSSEENVSLLHGDSVLGSQSHDRHRHRDRDQDQHPQSSLAVSSPRPDCGHALRIGASMYSFAVLGLFQSSIGVILQPLALHYSLSDLHVSLIFTVGPLGYVLAAQLSDHVHSTWGQRGIAFLAPVLHILGALGIAVHPPFPLVLMAYAAVGLGTGLLDGSWCAWAAGMPQANTVSGMIQGSFSVGAAAGPFLAGTVLPAWNRPWYDWGYVLMVASLIDLCVLLFAFRYDTASTYRAKQSTTVSPAMFKYPATWLIALYFLAYVGIETAISGWVIPFMLRYREAPPRSAGLASSAFWGGMALGRFVLGIVTDKLGVARANFIYFFITIAFQVVFAFLQSITISIVLVALIGFFMGPMFACGIVILTRLLPVQLHVASVSFAASAGQVGAALLPFAIGAFIQGIGIGVFRYAVVILTTLAFLTWIPVSQQRPITTIPP